MKKPHSDPSGVIGSAEVPAPVAATRCLHVELELDKATNSPLHPTLKMSALRLTSSLRVASRVQAATLRRGYAAAADDKLKLSLVLPHQALFSAEGVTQVNIPAATGDMGILANHVPAIEALRPGVVEVIEDGGKSGKWFVSTGFATMHGNNSLTINAVEAYPLENFSIENVRAGLAEANKVLGSSAPEAEKAEATIEVEVFEALQAALSK
ncbi:uncharacterized protein CcaverHIS019_0507230 [Cutaneotrichosporon cavernicola]|uniref:ATP synthase subunit delta, mitochondrial n=1 Tax=Cutaneotrichosporon cavernicola TaxID=279322 RepID=A0AA48L710_9TREE|nr:uncharacterized protein CcaverHIS019_0507230 [Cutaneotrichosporon cavernicola]BEI93095.1 hypothetical protein CcaverHIS019_0507230 [Cutaneotrichosporon cavernicola]BEJ00872.1 hypothetical protein CcaverHIS631_0507290 [Cutaneotrichosporon cavernicola]BEJ08638.1 hypothetical protein CcaverHIS641_0507320 [Cutaneotrichosporon cavernicola]